MRALDPLFGCESENPTTTTFVTCPEVIALASRFKVATQPREVVVLPVANEHVAKTWTTFFAATYRKTDSVRANCGFVSSDPGATD